MRIPATSLLLLFTACCLYGQTSVSPAPTAPLISVDADEVSLDLMVRDNKNRPVLDLDPTQIAVTDNGTPVKLSTLHLVKGETANGARITLVFGRLDSAGDKNARDAAGKILKAIPDGFPIAVMNVGGRLRLLQTFTTERASIEKAVAMATVQEKPGDVGNSVGPEKNLVAIAKNGADASGNSVSANDRAMAKVLLSCLEESQHIVQDQGNQPTLASLLALARNQREIAGRKVVIYFSQGFQPDANSGDMVHSIVGAANRSGVTLYTVDLSALDQQSSNQMMAAIGMGGAGAGLRAAASAGPVMGGTYLTPPGMLDQGADQAGRIENDSLAGSTSPLGALAAGTGGAYIIAGDSLKKPLKRLVEDMTTYYEASFVPVGANSDGRFRTVHVAPLRKNIILRYRAGYYAVPSGSDTAVKPFEAPLLKILNGAQLPDDVQFRAGVLQMGALQDGDANTLVIEAPFEELDIREDNNTKLYSLHVTMVAQIKNSVGTVIDHFSEDVHRHGAADSMQTSSSDVVTLQRHFVAPPGEYMLEAAILDHNSGRAGAQRINFKIAANPSGLGLSDLALVRRTDPFNADSDPLEPLRYGTAKVMPNLSGEVDKNAKTVSVFFIIHPGPDAAPIKLEMEVLKDGKSIGRMPLPVRSDAGAGTAVPYLGTIQAHSLSPGHYEVATSVSQGDNTAHRTVDFTIGGVEVASVDVPPGAANPTAQRRKDGNSASDSLSGIVVPKLSRLVITSPLNPLPPPTPDEIIAILARIKTRALHYSESLPNFSCVEVTTRSLDPSGKGAWKHKDSMAQLLTYRDNTESRTMLEADGKHSSAAPGDLKGMTSHGQFGGVLNAVFDPSAKTEFHWKEAGNVGTGMVHVFTYRVEQRNSNYGLTDNNNYRLNVAFHGVVYIDAATMGVRRITLEADDIPATFFIHASSVAVDYDYIVINGHDYLMPIHADVSIRQGKHAGVLNEIEFRDYRRFGSRIRMLGFTKPQAP